jgi:DNA-binding response OmpR family regulator
MDKGPVILIVEDDMMIADYLEETLLDAGFDVCGIARNTAEAVALAQIHHPALSVIDLRLANGEYGTRVAAALCVQGEIGILYATGNSRRPLLNEAVGQGCISKPYTSESVVAGLTIVAERMAKAAHLSNFPPGFRLLNA